MGARHPRRERPPAPREESTARAPCAFCVEKPNGPSGHAGLALQVHHIPSGTRGHVQLACAFCGTHWARRRVSAKTFEWRRLAG
jgi:hypothetical protein